ncbi:hypothetical protein CKALI_00415 [Corynebacterium kalinowskii]|uniref:Uncharacterized protein n=1 Tax=Corynebacterium kalinowskii TaxID=2675216 RepID=A0A6B8VHA7_9CORY|nr:hypothetical protein [Corynebacterium kalinowskii]QGU00984.1 hypothetical protein CKALI_00415 [Corynebacterium kalinowskii]
MQKTIGLLSGSLALIGWSVTMATHARVATGSLSHLDVNGGRVESAQAGRAIAIGSAGTLLPVGYLIARGTGAFGPISSVERTSLKVLGGLFLASVAMQVAGTRFERTTMAPTAAALGIGCLGLGLLPAR